MNWLDIVILVIAGAGLIKGLVDGMIKQFAALAALIAGFFLCHGIATGLHEWLTGFSWFPPKVAIIAAYILGFLIIAAVVLLAGIIVNKIIDVTPLSIVNHLVGGIVGIAMTVLFMSFLFNVIEKFDTTSAILPRESKVESRFYEYVRDIIPAVTPDSWFGVKDETAG